MLKINTTRKIFFISVFIEVLFISLFCFGNWVKAETGQEICAMEFTDAAGKTMSAGAWCTGSFGSCTTNNCGKGVYHFCKDGKEYSFGCKCEKPFPFIERCNCNPDSDSTGVKECAGECVSWTCGDDGCQDDGACCGCDNWSDVGCRAEGCNQNIGSKEMLRTRNCMPEGCAEEKECVNKDECKCGNGILESGEECDPGDQAIGIAPLIIPTSCEEKGLGEGTMNKCKSNCLLDPSDCQIQPAECGNGKIEIGELCDGDNLGGKTCKDFGMGGDNLRCNSPNAPNECTFNTDLCVPLSSVPPSGRVTSNCNDYCSHLSESDIEQPANQICICNPINAGKFEDIINNLIDFIFKIAIVLAPLMIIVGGFLFITSAGDPKKTSQAKSLMIWTAVGLLILLLSKGILGIINQLLGVKG